MSSPSSTAAVVSSNHNKRPRETNKRRQHYTNNPQRGGPGILLTCESGREGKCRREGLDILRFYWNTQTNAPSTPSNEPKQLSLEEELIALKTKKDPNDEPFGIFDTGCKGTVFVMCTLPNCSMISPIRKPKTQEPSEASVTSEHSIDRSKKRRLDESNGMSTTCTALQEQPPWDPVQTVRNVVHDLSSAELSNAAIPGSRFVTRMIPVQATCFASLDEIGLVLDGLLDRLLPTLSSKKSHEAPLTFSVNFKRRNCTALTRDAVIKQVATQIFSRTFWTVKLREPDFTVLIEVCKTLCGMSILPSSCQTIARNFNLANLRTKRGIASE
jgi:tRNA acetyltransferase TAN1